MRLLRFSVIRSVLMIGLAWPGPAARSDGPESSSTPATSPGPAASPTPASGIDSDSADAPPSVIIVNARIWTGVEGAPEAEALAIRASKFTAVGSNEEIRALADASTRVIDAGERRIIPGITDSHTHMISMGLQLARLELRAAESKEQFINAVSTAAASLSPGEWLLGGRFSVESWAEPASPCKEWIDPHTPGTPVFLTRMDGHQGLANSVALKYARIDRNGPPDPPGGEIERDPKSGEPTGILKDAAMDLVGRHIPAPTARERLEALRLASRVANAWGVTGVHDMSDPDDLAIFVLALRRGELTLRMRSYVQSEDFEKTLPLIKATEGVDPRILRVAGFKAYMDGSLGSRTAYMHDPYEDAGPHTKYPRGLRSGHATDIEAFRRQIRWAHERSLQMAVHAIGDQAVHEILDIYASLPDGAKRRHRVEHAQHLLPEDIERFGALGVVASMQPFHKADDGRYAEKAIGAERARTSYAFKSLLETGATVCFGSDCPVVTSNPFSGIAAAVGSRTLDGQLWTPEQSINRKQALTCYTAIPQVAAFQENELGTIEPGKLADLAMLDKDILSVPIDEIHTTESVLTMVNGQVVWQAGR